MDLFKKNGFLEHLFTPILHRSSSKEHYWIRNFPLQFQFIFQKQRRSFLLKTIPRAVYRTVVWTSIFIMLDLLLEPGETEQPRCSKKRRP